MARGKPKEKGKILQRQLLALELRKDGHSYRTIGDKLGIDHTQAFRDIQRELTRLAANNQNAAAELRQLELERLDQMAMSVMRLANVGQPTAVLSMLKIMERRAKLLGLDAPTRIAIEGGLDVALINRLVRAIQSSNLTPGDAFEELIREFEQVATGSPSSAAGTGAAADEG